MWVCVKKAIYTKNKKKMKEFKEFRKSKGSVKESSSMGVDAVAELSKLLSSGVEMEITTVSGDMHSDLDSKVTKALVALQFDMKYLHWGTHSFAEHKAFGKIYDSLNDSVDTLIEALQGMLCRRIKFDETVCLTNYSSLTPEYFDEKVKCIMCLYDYKEMQDPAIKNMVDEILGIVYKLKYLLSLKK